jgi:hypothetical protein
MNCSLSPRFDVTSTNPFLVLVNFLLLSDTDVIMHRGGCSTTGKGRVISGMGWRISSEISLMLLVEPLPPPIEEDRRDE